MRKKLTPITDERVAAVMMASEGFGWEKGKDVRDVQLAHDRETVKDWKTPEQVEAALEEERRAERERLALLLCSYGLCPPITCKHTDSFSCKDCWIAVLEHGKSPKEGGE